MRDHTVVELQCVLADLPLTPTVMYGLTLLLHCRLKMAAEMDSRIRSCTVERYKGRKHLSFNWWCVLHGGSM